MKHRIEKSTQKRVRSFLDSKFQIPACHRLPTPIEERCAVAGRPNSTKKGMTLLEIVIVMGILAILVSIIATSLSGFRNSKVLDTASEQILALLSEARGDTLSAKNGYQYGIHFEAAQIVRYRGATYSSSDVSNEVVPLDNALEISSISLTGSGAEVLFDRLTGKTSQGGTIVVRVKSDTAKSRTITIVGTGIASGS